MMTTLDQARSAAKKAPENRSTQEQEHVDNCWNYQEIRNLDFKARGNKRPGE